MAKDNGNGLEGLIGEVIYYTVNGQKRARIKPAHVENPKTDNQVNHRTRIQMTGKFVKAIHSFIKIGYQASEFDSAYNEACRFMIRNCFANTSKGLVLNYQSMMISRGEITPPIDYSMVVEGTKARIMWQPPVKNDGTNPEDKVMVVMFCEEGNNGITWLKKNVAERSAGNAIIEISKQQKPIHVWMFFHNPDYSSKEDRMKISDSVYLGEIR